MSICIETQIEIRYAYADIVKQTSDRYVYMYMYLYTFDTEKIAMNTGVQHVQRCPSISPH